MRFVVFSLLLFHSIWLANTLATNKSALLDEWFNRVTDPAVYRKWIRPHLDDGPIRVNISLHLYTAASLDEVSMEYSAQLLLRMSWVDNRLRDDTIEGELTEGNEFYFERIWIPLLHVPNNRESDPITDTKHTLFRIYTNGTILTSKRVKLRVICNMNLHNYPLDKQACDIAFESSSLPVEQLCLHWSTEEPVHLTNTFQLMGFNLINVSLLEGVSQFSQTGNFSKVIVRFETARRFGQYLLDVYIPTMLFVTTSWISFWIQIPAAPARVTLGMTTMLTLVTSAKNTREKLAHVSYIHALDVWIVTCVFEYAAVNHIYFKDQRCKKRRIMQKTLSTASFFSVLPDQASHCQKNIPEEKGLHHLPSYGSQNCLPPSPGTSLHLNKPRFSIIDLNTSPQAPSRSASIQIDPSSLLDLKCSQFCNTQDLANAIDRKCRVIYPLLFLTFNVVYWSVICAIE